MPAAHVHGAAERIKPRWEVADILRLYGEAFRRACLLPPLHIKILRALTACRTPALGGHRQRCDICGVERNAYNSCRNRHCPKCQSLAKAKWLEARSAELLPVGYFHAVFTLPHTLNPLILCNKAVVLGILFAAAAQTLLQFGRNPGNGLGGKLGFLAVLHTWDQRLLDHFHLHCLVPAGALSPDGRRWIAAQDNFLFPVKALGKVFRGKFIALLKQSFAEQRLVFPGRTAALGTPGGFAALIGELYEKDWVVYCKPPFGGPWKVLDYLGRYTHRVAISNHRILDVRDGNVKFSYRDRADGDKVKTMTLRAEEFIRRFLLHALPPSFMRIRHFGFLANRCKGRNLQRCRELLGVPVEADEKHPAAGDAPRHGPAQEHPMLCPFCKAGTMRAVMPLPKLPIHLWPHFPYPLPRLDSS
jgi:hypothetical protein